MKAIHQTTGEGREAETELCISCLHGNVPGTHFCPHCGAPLTSYATTGPLEHAFAFGDFFRKSLNTTRWAGWVRGTVLLGTLALLISVLTGLLLP